jgi:hypothetical protein
MNKYALIHNGIVENIIVVDNTSDYTKPDGYDMVLADNTCHMNCKYENGKFFKNLEYIGNQVRNKRNNLLSETDLWVIPDRFATFSEAKKQEILDYRQALRDVSSQEGFPEDVIYPTKPEV